MSKPLIELLKSIHSNGIFKRSQHQNNLKNHDYYLYFNDFTKHFLFETDACNAGIGAMLIQDGNPLVFMRKPLSLQNLGLSTYEKDMLAVPEIIKKIIGHIRIGIIL